MSFNFELIRLETAHRCAKLGITIPVGVPPIICETEIVPKTEIRVKKRALALFCALAVVFEPKSTFKDAVTEVTSWATTHNLSSEFSDHEAIVFKAKNNVGLADKFWGEQESLYALGWSLGLVNHIDPTDYLPDVFGNIFPDISKSESSDSFINQCELRSVEIISAELDFWYCFHWWAVENRNVTAIRKVQKLSTIAIKARRKSLEWLLTAQEWDEVALDT